MKLYMAPISPFARKVRIVALNTRQDLECVNVDVYDPTSIIRQINPLSKVPALIVNPQLTLCDSALICEYLDANTKGARVIPIAGENRWRQLAWQAIADGMADAAVLIRMETMRDLAKQDDEWIRRQSEKIIQGLNYLENCADQFQTDVSTIGEVSIACAIGYIEYRLSTSDFFIQAPKLKAWAAKINADEKMMKTAPPAPAKST